MAFCIDNVEKMVLTRLYEADGENEYGSPLLRREPYRGRLDSVRQLLDAFSWFGSRSAGRDVVVTISSGKGNGTRFFGLDEGSVENGMMVFRLSEFEGPPPPLPLGFLVGGIRQELEGKDDGMRYEFRCGGTAFSAKELTLDVVRFPDNPEVYYFLHFELERVAGAARGSEDAAGGAPETVGQLRSAVAGMKSATGRDIGRKPMLFADENGGVFVVDTVSKRGQHVEIAMMRLDMEKDFNWVMNRDGASVDDTLAMFRRAPDGDQMFFMIDGKPYGISNMEAKAGRPVVCEIVPWGSLDESRGPFPEIAEWARSCGEPVLDWPV